MTVKSYKELVAYQKSYGLAVTLYEETKSFPRSEIFGITSQVRRSAVSVPSNIAEGYMKGSREYIKFLKIALGSAAELETQISLSKDFGFMNKACYERCYSINEEVLKLLRTYIKKLG